MTEYDHAGIHSRYYHESAHTPEENIAWLLGKDLLVYDSLPHFSPRTLILSAMAVLISFTLSGSCS